MDVKIAADFERLLLCSKLFSTARVTVCRLDARLQSLDGMAMICSASWVANLGADIVYGYNSFKVRVVLPSDFYVYIRWGSHGAEKFYIFSRQLTLFMLEAELVNQCDALDFVDQINLKIEYLEGQRPRESPEFE